jgi:hypothetical protein
MARGFKNWNSSPSSAERSKFPEDASNRILNGYFTPELLPDARRVVGSDGIFAMGSCFAREIEAALRQSGFNILSMDLDLLEQGPFSDDKGIRTGFFHRFNVPAMELEFRRAFDDVPFDESRDLLIEAANGRFADLNYFPVLERLDRNGMLTRRRIGREMVGKFTRARAIILTLGMTEAWFHEPSGMYCDGVAGDLLARHRKQFTYRNIGFRENYESLQRIYDFIARLHVDGDYSLFVTVSPVPLQTTFSETDVVVANSASKTTLRAVAAEFCNANEKAVYFPSYEMAMFSAPHLVWRPDRVHILHECVKHITSVFEHRYTDRGGRKKKR